MSPPDVTNQRVRAASARRRDQHKTDTREAIFRAAADLLAEDGFAAFSLRKLAARIGYTPTTIYRHFRDKDALVLAVMLEGFALFTARLRAAVESSPDPREQLRALGEAYVRFGLEQPVFYQVMFMQHCELWLQLAPESRGEMMTSYELLVGTLTRLAASGQVRIDDVETTADVVWAQVHGIVTLALTMQELGTDHAHAMAARANDLMMHGLLTR